MGLLSSVGNTVGGLLGKQVMGIPVGAMLGIPQSEEHLRTMLAGGPEKMAELERIRRQQQMEELQLKSAQMQMEQFQKAQGKDDITSAMIQSMNLQVADAVQRLRSSLASNDMAGAQKARNELDQLQSPEYQNLLRGHLATQGNLQMAEQAGMVQKMPEQYAPPEIVKQLQAAGIDPQSEQGKRIIVQHIQQGSLGSTPANIQEWDRYSRMTPEEQVRYLQLKRADRWIDTGGSNVRIDPVSGAPVYEVPNTLPPDKQAEVDANAASNALTVNELRSIIEPGGLLDQSTGSGLGAARDAVAGVFGASTGGAEAIAQLRPIAHRVLMNVPRFSGPQSDRDVQAYREAAGQIADPTLPVAVRKAAVKTIIDLTEKARQYNPRLSYPTGQPSPAQTRSSAAPRLRYNPQTGALE